MKSSRFTKILSLMLALVLFATMLPVESFAASITYYQTTIADAAVRPGPGKKHGLSYNIKAKGTVVKVVGSTKNSAGNLWYQLNDGKWIYSENVTRHNHSYSGGICTGNGCSYEWPYSVQGASGTYVVTKSDGAAIRNRPYSKNSVTVAHAGYGTVYTVVGKTKNEEGNLWYKLSNGNWVFSDNVTQRFTVTFNANGGSGAPGAINVLYKSNLKVPTTKPTRKGYVFKGWAATAGANNASFEPGKSYPYTATYDLTFYAVWKACSHDYQAGVCSKCGVEYPLNVTAMSGNFRVMIDDAAIRVKPYSNAAKVRLDKKGTVLKVVGKAKNSADNLWYKLSDGNWIFSDNVKQQFSVTYDATGGTGAPGVQTVLKDEVVRISSKEPTRVGYVFKGWSVSRSALLPSHLHGNLFTYTFDKDTTLYALWKECSHDFAGGICKTCRYEFPLKVSNYSGTFVVTNADGAKIWNRPYSHESTHLRTEKKGAALTVVAKTTNEPGNLWYKLSDGSWVSAGNVAQQFTVTFNLNGGAGDVPAMKALLNNSFKVPTTKPTRKGYTFVGWADKANATKATIEPGKTYNYNAEWDLVLYAVWKECSHDYSGGICKKCGHEYALKITDYAGNFLVTNAEGAKVWNRPYSNNSNHIRTEKKGAVLKVVSKTTNQEGNIWYRLSDGNWIFGGNVSQRFVVSYNLNGGSGSFADQTAEAGSTLKLHTDKPKRDGYIFQGWALSANASSADYKAGGSYQITSDMKLHAVWKACKHDYSGGICKTCGYEYPLKFESGNLTVVVTNADGAKVWSRPYSTNSKHIRTEKKGKELSVVGGTINQEGNGWYKLSDGNWVFTGNVTRQYVLSFDANGGKGAPKAMKILYRHEFKVPTTKPTRVGYVFQGWAVTKNATKVDYTPGEALRYGNPDNLTFYAVWKACTHKYEAGICTVCGYEYGLNTVAHAGTFVVSNASGAAIRQRPYKSAKQVRKEKHNAVLTVTHRATNQEGNVWYQLSDGNWVFSDNVAQRYTVTFNANGGMNPPKAQYTFYGKDMTIPTEKPTRKDYVFVGWANTPDATNGAFQPGKTHTYAAKNDLTLYAIWKQCTHSGGFQAQVTKPTCTEGGYTTYTCTCGYSYVDNRVDPKGHSFGSWYATKVPTCTDKGTERRDCTGCGYYEVREANAKGHSYETITVDPTCTERGHTQYHCTGCGDEYIGDYKEPTGHVIETDMGFGADCVSSGLTDGAHCGVCGLVTKEQKVIPALGHDYVSGTCTRCGVKETSLEAPAVLAENVASSGKIKLTWDKVEGAVKYRVYRSTDLESWTLMMTTTGTKLTHSSAKAGVTYFYYVEAVAENGETAAGEMDFCICRLARPTVKLSSVTSTGKIRIQWEKVPGATAYAVYRSESKNGTYKLLKETTGTSLVNSKDTKAGKTYYYKVQALAEDSAADSEFSSIKNRTCDLAQPDASVKRNSKGKPVVSWEKVSGAQKYKVYIYNASGKLLKTSTTSKTSLTHGSAKAGTRYTYRVVAVHSNSSANSAKSASVSIQAK